MAQARPHLLSTCKCGAAVGQWLLVTVIPRSLSTNAAYPKPFLCPTPGHYSPNHPRQRNQRGEVRAATRLDREASRQVGVETWLNTRCYHP